MAYQASGDEMKKAISTSFKKSDEMRPTMLITFAPRTFRSNFLHTLACREYRQTKQTQAGNEYGNYSKCFEDAARTLVGFIHFFKLLIEEVILERHIRVKCTPLGLDAGDRLGCVLSVGFYEQLAKPIVFGKDNHWLNLLV